MNQKTWLIIIALAALAGVVIGLAVPAAGPYLWPIALVSLIAISAVRFFESRKK